MILVTKAICICRGGRGCVEFWLDKCMHKNIQIEIAKSSALLDTNENAEDKLYGYHRLKDPLVVF